MTSLFTGVWVWLDSTKPYYYNILPLLPMIFGLLNLFSFKIYQDIPSNLAVSIIVGLYYIRNVVSIFIMSLGNYSGVFLIRSEESVFYALLLMISETVVVFMTIMFYRRINFKKNVVYRHRYLIMRGTNKRVIKIFGIVVVLSTLILILSYITIPEIKLTYTNIFASGISINSIGETETNLLVPRGGLKRILYTLFIFLFNFWRIFISAWLIYLNKIKIKNGHISMILNVLIIFSNIFFIFSETIFVFIIIAILSLLLIKLYPTKVKSISIILMTGIIVVGILLFNVKMGVGYITSSKFESISMVMQAYFPGICNLAGVFNIVNPNKISTLFFDFYYMIPFRGTLFGIEGDRLVIEYNKSNNVFAQIIPCVGQAYHYIGLFAPIASMFFVIIAMKYENKRKKEQNMWKYITFVLIVIYAAATPVLYNITIFGSHYFGLMLPVLVLAHYSGNAFIFSNIKNREKGT
jgi:hypothetical protein